MKQGVGHANAKIILMGEHAVVYDAYAIAIPFLTTKMVVTLTKGENTIKSELYQGNLDQAPKLLAGFVELFETLKAKHQDTNTYHVEVQSEIPMQRGMGSSAALSNALIDAYYAYHHQTISFAEKFELSMIAETINHGRPSGIDSLTTMSTLPVYFKKGPHYEHIAMACDGYLVVVDSGIQGETLEAVQHVANQMHLETTQAAIATLDALSQQAKVALTHNDLTGLGRYMNQAHALLDALGVSHPIVNEMVQHALSKGALGAKMSGGGRGGVMISVFKEQNQVEGFITFMKTRGYHKAWVMNLREAFQ